LPRFIFFVIVRVGVLVVFVDVRVLVKLFIIKDSSSSSSGLTGIARLRGKSLGRWLGRGGRGARRGERGAGL
jgi:hypothetical protein